MFRRHVASGLSLLILAACVAPAEISAPLVPDETPRISRSLAQQNYATAIARIEPIAEQECAERTRGLNCDFLIRIDPNPNAPVNAFQTLDAKGRPLLVFTQSLIAEARNVDEIAFVVGHEAAHHISQHIAQQQQSAAIGALFGGLIATTAGASEAMVQEISRVGATVGARRFSKDHELEADAIGTVIAHRAGFDPVRGSVFFARTPDPGDRFLGTHPPNADRVATVRRVAAGL